MLTKHRMPLESLIRPAGAFLARVDGKDVAVARIALAGPWGPGIASWRHDLKGGVVGYSIDCIDVSPPAGLRAFGATLRRGTRSGLPPPDMAVALRGYPDGQTGRAARPPAQGVPSRTRTRQV